MQRKYKAGKAIVRHYSFTCYLPEQEFSTVYLMVVTTRLTILRLRQFSIIAWVPVMFQRLRNNANYLQGWILC